MEINSKVQQTYDKELLQDHYRIEEMLSKNTGKEWLKWMVIGQSERSEGIKLDGLKVQKWTVMYETGWPKRT